MQRANIDKAGFAIVFAEDATTAADQKTALTVLAIKNLNASITTCAELNDAKNEPHLRRAGCDVVVNTADLTSKLLALSIENPAINNVVKELVSRTRDNEVYRVACPPKYVGKSFEPTFPIWLNIPLSKSSAFFKPLSICETLAVGMAIITGITYLTSLNKGSIM